MDEIIKEYLQRKEIFYFEPYEITLYWLENFRRKYENTKRVYTGKHEGDDIIARSVETNSKHKRKLSNK